MAQIRNKSDIKKSILDEAKIIKRLPNFFLPNDEINFTKGIMASFGLHLALIFLLISLNAILLPFLPKPKLPDKNIEFKLVDAPEKPPINKNTKIRSDRNSQAGGKHDPKKAISDPTPIAPKKAQSAPKGQNKIAQKPTPKPVQKPAPKTVQKPVPKTTPKPVQKSVTKPTPKVVQAPTPKAPVAPKAPSAPSTIRPSAKPTPKAPSAVPTAPKIATAPKSPFVVPTAPSKAPVGTTYRPSGTSSGGSPSASKGAGAPAPKFSSAGGSSGGSSAGRPGGSSGTPNGNRYASKGSYGGSGGNPGPGNPSGAPGIDAIRQPNWGPYMRDLEQKIRRNWHPPKGDSSKRVVITFVISRDGRLLSHKVTKSSGVPLADRAAMSAIESTAPFKPLPPEFKGQSVPIEFTFDYNVLNSVIR